jgi:hypothetical protein
MTDPDRLDAYRLLTAHQSPPKVTAPIAPALAHTVKLRYASAFFTHRDHDAVRLAEERVEVWHG